VTVTESESLRHGDTRHFLRITEAHRDGGFIAERFDGGFVHVLADEAWRVPGGLAIGDVIKANLRRSPINGSVYAHNVSATQPSIIEGRQRNDGALAYTDVETCSLRRA
jgi:hypothetical protein